MANSKPQLHLSLKKSHDVDELYHGVVSDLDKEKMAIRKGLSGSDASYEPGTFLDATISMLWIPNGNLRDLNTLEKVGVETVLIQLKKKLAEASIIMSEPEWHYTVRETNENSPVNDSTTSAFYFPWFTLTEKFVPILPPKVAPMSVARVEPVSIVASTVNPLIEVSKPPEQATITDKKIPEEKQQVSMTVEYASQKVVTKTPEEMYRGRGRGRGGWRGGRRGGGYLRGSDPIRPYYPQYSNYAANADLNRDYEDYRRQYDEARNNRRQDPVATEDRYMRQQERHSSYTEYFPKNLLDQVLPSRLQHPVNFSLHYSEYNANAHHDGRRRSLSPPQNRYRSPPQQQQQQLAYPRAEEYYRSPLTTSSVDDYYYYPKERSLFDVKPNDPRAPKFEFISKEPTDEFYRKACLQCNSANPELQFKFTEGVKNGKRSICPRPKHPLQRPHPPPPYNPYLKSIPSPHIPRPVNTPKTTTATAPPTFTIRLSDNTRPPVGGRTARVRGGRGGAMRFNNNNGYDRSLVQNNRPLVESNNDLEIPLTISPYGSNISLEDGQVVPPQSPPSSSTTSSLPTPDSIKSPVVVRKSKERRTKPRASDDIPLDDSSSSDSDILEKVDYDE